MNDQVRAFLDKAKDKKLISMGLIEETRREYGPYSPKYRLFEKETRRYYRDIPIPIEISDEEFEKLLMYEKIKETIPQEKEDDIRDVRHINNTAEKILNTFNVIALVIGITAALVCVILGFIDSMRLGYMAILIGIAITIPIILSWAMLKVYINISNNLHEINSKMR